MNVTIINTGSGVEKVCTFVDLSARGAWAEIRYPGAVGLFAFSLVHGGMECKRDEHPAWQLSDDSLAELRVLAKDKGIKFSPHPKRPKHAPTQPKKPGWRQVEMFK